ncbi:MAG: efflux transporter periplasmic adaptor subunit [Bacteroidales bacterium 45-6]|nr:MAG: efflux transporter periplasmic adaptor subunit [Bacteroidales bacterium 45-6]
MKKFFKIFALVILGLILIATFYFLWKKSQPEKIVYQIETVKTGTIENSIVATGKVSPRDEILIKPQISGIITELTKEAGDYITAGEVIAKVKVVPDISQLNSAESRVTVANISLNQVKSEYDRQKQLFSKGVISKEDMDASETSLRKAKEELETSKDNLDIVKTGISKKTAQYSNTQIRSTITGTILDIPVKVGNSVIQANTFNDGTTIASVANMGDLLFVGKIDETEVGRIHTDMPMKLSVGALNNLKFDATLEYIAPKGTEENGAILFEIKGAAKVPNSVKIRAGYSANAEIVVEQASDVLTVPESCVIFENNKPYVYVLKTATPEQTFEKRAVTTGLSNGISIEVKSGLKKSEKIRGLAIDKTEKKTDDKSKKQ